VYVISIEAKNLDQASKVLGKLDKVLDSRRNDMAVEALNSAAKVWSRNFIGEGSEVGGWRELAERTVEQRERLGFGGEHPIMIRYGQLRELTTENLMRTRSPSGSWTRSDPQGGSIHVSLSTRNGHMEVVATGNKAMNQERSTKRPPRPYWFVNPGLRRDVRNSVSDFLTGELRRIAVI